MKTRSEWFLGCGGSLELNAGIDLCSSNMEPNATNDDSRGNYATNHLCGHKSNDNGSLRAGICTC